MLHVWHLIKGISEQSQRDKTLKKGKSFDVVYAKAIIPQQYQLALTNHWSAIVGALIFFVEREQFNDKLNEHLMR